MARFAVDIGDWKPSSSKEVKRIAEVVVVDWSEAQRGPCCPFL